MPRWWKAILLVLAASTAFVWYAVFSESRAGVAVHVFDVGQGDAIFIEAANGNQVLIDGGPGARVLSHLGRVMPFYDRSIDVVILSHPHADHLAGLVEALKRYRVGTVLMADAAYSSGEYAEWQRLLTEKKVRGVFAHAGQVVKLAPDAALHVLSPFRSFSSGEPPKNIHAAMVTAKLTVGSSTILFMGDAERMLEQQLVLLGADVDADILKVGHHGSKTSTSDDFLRAVSPDAAVISVGKGNRYGHPHLEVLERLEDGELAVYRTDRDGTIVLESDGTGFVRRAH